MSNEQSAVFEFLNRTSGYSCEIYRGRIRQGAMKTITKQTIIALCGEGNHYFGSDVTISCDGYFYCKLYTD